MKHRNFILIILLLFSGLVGAQSLRTIKTDFIVPNVSGGDVDVTATFSINSSTGINDILDEDDMASDTTSALATQQSIKAYVDGSIDTTLTASVAANTASIVTITASTSNHDTEIALLAKLDDVTQTITASAFVGDGSGLTGVLADTSAIEALVATNTASISGLTADDIAMDLLGSPSNTTIQDWSDGVQSAGIIGNTGAITDAGSGTVAVSELEGIFKTTNSSTGDNVFFTLSASASVTLIDESTNFISVDYNGGTPILGVTPSNIANGHTIFNLGKVFREGTAVDIIDSGLHIEDFSMRVQQKQVALAGIHFVSGATVGATGSLELTISVGVMYAGLNKIITPSFDSSGTDTFEYYYYDGAAWQKSDETEIDVLQYNNVAAGLATLAPQRYGIHWVYKGTNGNAYVVYGVDSYTLTEAQAEGTPAILPPHVSGFGVLRAKIIIKKSGVAFTEIQSVEDTVFSSSVASNHNELANIDGGTAGEYYHFNASEYTELNEWLDNVTLGATGYTTVPGLNVNGSISINEIPRVCVPDQTDFLGTMYLGNGNGGTSLTHTGGTEGQGNTFVGINSASNTTTGYYNSIFGYGAGNVNITGTKNVAVGFESSYTQTSASNNVGVGYKALYYNNANSNTAFGYESLTFITGTGNIGIGYRAGRNAAVGNNSASTYSVYLGLNTKSSATGNTNEIVIGTNAIGNGSNTVTLGADTITGTYLKGDVTTTGSISIAALSTESAPTNYMFRDTDGVIKQAPVSGGGFANPMTATGSLIIGGDSGTAEERTIGSNGQVLTSDGITVNWQDPAASPLVAYVLGEDLSAGDLVTLASSYTSGTGVVKGLITGTTGLGSKDAANASVSEYMGITYNASSSEVAMSYRDAGGSYLGKYSVGTVSGTTLTWNSEITFHNASTNRTDITYSASGDKYMVVYIDNDDSGKGKIHACTSSSCGTETVFFDAAIDTSNNNVKALYLSDHEVTAVTWRDSSNNGWIKPCWISTGTTVVCGTDYEFEATSASNFALAYDSENKNILISYIAGASAAPISAKSCSYSSSTSSFTCGTISSIEASATDEHSLTYNKRFKRVISVFEDGSAAKVRVGSMVGTTITWDTVASLGASFPYYNSVTCGENTGRCIAFYNAAGSAGKYVEFILTEAGITAQSEANFNAGSGALWMQSVYDTNEGKTIVGWKDAVNDYATGIVFNEDNRPDFFGILQESGSKGESKYVARSGQISTVHTGELTVGGSYYVTSLGVLTEFYNEYKVGVSLTATNLLVTY